MSTGSQGEPMAVLARMANLDHQIEVGHGDTVILASSLIPGNENAVYRVIDGLTKLGANVVHKGNAKVHVSGHAAAGELLYCYNILKPKNVMPVHGEYRHLVANARLAMDTGVPEKNTILAEDGTVIDLRDGVARVVGQLDLGFVYVDGSSVGEITDADLKDRRILGEEGFISIIVVVEAATRPDRHRTGDPRRAASPRTTRCSTRSSRRSPRRSPTRPTTASATRTRCRQVVRRTVGRWVNTSYRRRPMIVPAGDRGLSSAFVTRPKHRGEYRSVMSTFRIRPAAGGDARVHRRHARRGRQLEPRALASPGDGARGPEGLPVHRRVAAAAATSGRWRRTRTASRSAPAGAALPGERAGLRLRRGRGARAHARRERAVAGARGRAGAAAGGRPGRAPRPAFAGSASASSARTSPSGSTSARAT